MSFRVPIILLLLSAGGFAQLPDASANQKLIEELRGVRATLEKLEKGQKAQIILARIQIDESRAATLETQRLQLLAEEQDLEKDAARDATVSRTEGSAGRTLVRVAPDGSQEILPSPPPNSGSTTADPARNLDDVRRSRQSLDVKIAELREQIAVWEKQLDEVLR
jgi:hypothetical protein